MSNRGDFSPNRSYLDPIVFGSDDGLDSGLLNAHGRYETMRFVLRLSPKNHELVDQLTTGAFSLDEISNEALQAYSTYVHETVHWWQHVGSTSGLVYSLCYMAQCHGSMLHLKEVISHLGLHKSLKSYADQTLQREGIAGQERLAQANIAVNNALDVEYFRAYVTKPRKAAEWLITQQHFECIGHSYIMAYGLVVNMIGATMDPQFDLLPDPDHWTEKFRSIRERRVTGYYWGSPIYVPPLGLHALYEGQARFVQLQFLDGCFSNGPSLDAWRQMGYLDAIYGEAFTKFVELTQSEMPSHLSDPLVNLFLLVCDVAINPSRGITTQIENFEDFIDDVDAGIRFVRLCQAVVELPSVRTSIEQCSYDDYVDISRKLCAQCGLDDPISELDKISDWIANLPGAQSLAAEDSTFDFAPTNLPVRVFLAKFLAFSKDKRTRPEFFCWPGRWMAGEKADAAALEIWLRHLSLFTDRPEQQGVYPREQTGRDPSLVQRTFENFYAGIALYDITRQWILYDGPFNLDFDWLTNAPQESAVVENWVNDVLARTYGVRLHDFLVREPK